MDHHEAVQGSPVPHVWSRSTLLVAAVVAVSIGNILAKYWEHWFVPGVLLSILAGILGYAACWAPRGPALPVVWMIAVVASAVSLDRSPVTPILVPIVVVAVISAMVTKPRLYPVVLILLASLIWVSTFEAIHIGSARIDVFNMIQNATTALVHGSDPYRSTSAVDDTTTSPPTTYVARYGYGASVLVLAAPGRLLGDVRFAGAAMMVITGLGILVLCRRTEGGRALQSLSCLMVVSPLAPSMVALAWADVYAAAPLAVWLALRDRHRNLGVIALGFCIAAKTTVGAVLLVAALWSRSARRDLLPGAGVAGLIYVPFIIWDGPGSFWAPFFEGVTGTGPHSLYQNRPDALTINSLVHALAGNWLPPLVLFAMVVVLAVPVLLTRPRDSCDTLALGAALTIVILVSGRLAYLNYYFVATVALLLALACEGATDRARDVALPSGIEALMRRASLAIFAPYPCSRGCNRSRTARSIDLKD